MHRLLLLLTSVLALAVGLPACGSTGEVVTMLEQDSARWIVDEEVLDVVAAPSVLAEPHSEDTERYQYRMGPGDVFRLSVWSDEVLSGQYKVGPDGDITLPLFGTIPLQGLTREEAAARIQTRIEEQYRDPRVSVIVEEFNNNNVFLLGAFEWPGEYKLESQVTLLQALSLAQGFKTTADTSGLTITRGNDTIYKINLEDLVHGGNMALNVRLFPGDVVYLPENTHRVVHVLGEVASPGLVPVGRGIDILRALAGAGSVTEDAILDEVRVIRRQGDKVRMITVNVEAILEDGALAANIPLQPDDVVYVPTRGLAQFNYVLRQVSPSLSTLLLFDAVNQTQARP